MLYKYCVTLLLEVRPYLLCLALNACISPLVYASEVIANFGSSHELQQASIDLRAIFTMRIRYWANGEKIKVFVLPDNNALHKKFVKEKLQMFPHQLRRTWNRMIYTGTGQTPVTVGSISEMLEKIKDTQYSIGYIDRRVEDEAIYVFNAQ